MKKRMVSFLGVMTAVVLATGCSGATGAEGVDDGVEVEETGFEDQSTDDSIVETEGVSMDGESAETAAE
ncbi:MAG: hypothetical protein J5504_07695 [Butyrivibrio sp.]|nr:hypothetical protein [Butyrivibrio sp.]